MKQKGAPHGALFFFSEAGRQAGRFGRGLTRFVMGGYGGAERVYMESGNNSVPYIAEVKPL